MNEQVLDQTPVEVPSVEPLDEPNLLTFPEAMVEVLKGNFVTKVEWGDESIYVYLGDFLNIKNL